MAYYYKYNDGTGNGQFVSLPNEPLVSVQNSEGDPSSVLDTRYTPITKDQYFNSLDFMKATPTQQNYMVSGDIAAGQDTLAELIKRRGEYIQTTSDPYKQQLFSSMSYGNPGLESGYINAAIPQIQADYHNAGAIQNRLAGATGVNLDQAEQKLMNRMNILKQEETIGSAAKQIKQRLKERDLTASMGTSGATNEIMNQAY